MMILYFILTIIIPIIIMLIHKAYLISTIWAIGGFIIILLENTKKGKKIKEILF